VIDEILTRILTDQWRVIAIVSMLLLAATELGFWFGLRLYRVKGEG